MNKCSVIVFDLGNVLISFDYTPFVEKLNTVKAGLGNKISELYKNNYHIHREFESGKLNNKQFLEIMMSWTEGLVSEEYFCRIFSEIFTENLNVVSLLQQLKEKYKLVLLSNTNAIHKKYGWEHYDFLKYFDLFCLSHEIGAVKPEEKIYKYVESLTHALPEEHVFIDDVLEYANGARKAGWDAIHFTGYDNLTAELSRRNIL
jgi:glucose-1-phosphatase